MKIASRNAHSMPVVTQSTTRSPASGALTVSTKRSKKWPDSSVSSPLAWASSSAALT